MQWITLRSLNTDQEIFFYGIKFSNGLRNHLLKVHRDCVMGGEKVFNLPLQVRPSPV